MEAAGERGATLGGALTVQAVKGIATFTGLSINMLAEGYTFLATTPGLSSGATLPFNVTDQLVVTTQPPSSLPVGTPFDLVVQVENGDGAVDTSFQSNVTVRDYYGHHVYGATTVQAVNGVASPPPGCTPSPSTPPIPTATSIQTSTALSHSLFPPTPAARRSAAY